MENLESRLQEYIRRKKYNKENNIRDSLVEKEFNINNNDIITIKKYFKNKINQESHTDYVEQRGQNFPSSEFIKDPRLEKLKQKQKQHKSAENQRHNYGIISKGYDMYREDRQFASANGNDFKSRFNPSVWFENTKLQDADEDDSPNRAQIVDMRKRFSSTNVYKNEPVQIRYKDYLPYGCNDDLSKNNYSVDSIIGNLDSYRNNVEKIHDRKNEMDLYHKVVIPNNNNSNKRDVENNYQAVPYSQGAGAKDVNMETYLTFGVTPSRGSKALGYPNPVEHYFDYVSDEKQKPEHCVFERGTPSRLWNKNTAKPYQEREVM